MSWLRRLLPGKIRCARCGAHLDRDVSLFKVVSPTRLQAEHVPFCPARPSIFEAYAS